MIINLVPKHKFHSRFVLIWSFFLDGKNMLQMLGHGRQKKKKKSTTFVTVD